MKADRAASLFWMIFGTAIMYMSAKLGIGTLAHFGPGFIPIVTGGFLFLFSCLVFVQSQAGHARRIEELWTAANGFKPVLVVLTLLAYALTFSHLGFLLATTLFLVFLLKSVYPTRWGVAIGFAALAALASFILFDVWLRVQLPHGWIERSLYRIKGL